MKTFTFLLFLTYCLPLLNVFTWSSIVVACDVFFSKCSFASTNKFACIVYFYVIFNLLLIPLLMLLHWSWMEIAVACNGYFRSEVFCLHEYVCL